MCARARSRLRRRRPYCGVPRIRLAFRARRLRGRWRPIQRDRRSLRRFGRHCGGRGDHGRSFALPGTQQLGCAFAGEPRAVHLRGARRVRLKRIAAVAGPFAFVSARDGVTRRHAFRARYLRPVRMTRPRQQRQGGRGKADRADSMEAKGVVHDACLSVQIDRRRRHRDGGVRGLG